MYPEMYRPFLLRVIKQIGVHGLAGKNFTNRALFFKKRALFVYFQKMLKLKFYQYFELQKTLCESCIIIFLYHWFKKIVNSVFYS